MPTRESLKDTFESIIIAFLLAFVFRAYVVEAFIIPTGSMAPTLLGEHLRVTCDQCGHRFTVDVDRDDRVERIGPGVIVERPYVTQPQGLTAACSMCFNPVQVPRGSWINAGDRILVHKYIYNFTEPRRWDVVVFKYPADPGTNFIKRLVGLPGEDLLIVEGNVYARAHNGVAKNQAGDDGWRVQRKSDRPKVQRSVWQPVYYSDHYPLDRGDANRSASRVRYAWRLPWIASQGLGQWDFSQGTHYQFNSDGGGQLRFDFESSAGQPRYPYNQFKENRPEVRGEPMEDVRLAARFTPEKAGLSVALQTSARWGSLNNHQPVNIVGRIDAQGNVVIELPGVMDEKTGKPTQLSQGQTSAFAPGRAQQVELWYVDQQVSLWVDGAVVAEAQFDLDMQSLRNRPALPIGYTPDVRVDVLGSAVLLSGVELDRDLYYSSNQSRGRSRPGLGALVKEEGGTFGEPVTLAEDHFYVLGDNSPWSKDSRYWDALNPWIAQRMFEGHDMVGIVPRKLMIGRAFFVYWPAMYSLGERRRPMLPNFGDMRFIH